jgi:hypothetical protein
MVHQCARPCHCTGCRHRPCMPSPPDKVLPSHHHPKLGGLPTPTKTLTTLAQVTSPCCSVVLSPTTLSTISSTPSLLPFTFSNKVCLSLGGETAHPFCAGGQIPPPWKRTQHKHQPHCVGRRHGPRAPNPQEHLLHRHQHWPRAPNQSISNGWTLGEGDPSAYTLGILLLSVLFEALGEYVASCSFGGIFWETIFLAEVYLLLVFPFDFWLLVESYIAVLLHPVPRVVPLGFSLHPSLESRWVRDEPQDLTVLSMANDPI